MYHHPCHIIVGMQLIKIKYKFNIKICHKFKGEHTEYCSCNSHFPDTLFLCCSSPGKMLGHLIMQYFTPAIAYKFITIITAQHKKIMNLQKFFINMCCVYDFLSNLPTFAPWQDYPPYLEQTAKNHPLL